MQSIKSIDLSVLPEWARQEVYDFFVFMKQRIEHQRALIQMPANVLCLSEGKSGRRLE